MTAPSTRGAALLGLMMLAACTPPPPDPLTAYLGNTLIAIDPTGLDDSHLWLEPDGSYTLIGGMPTAQAGRFTHVLNGPAGTMRLCLRAAAGVTVPEAFGLRPATVRNRFRDTPCVTLTAHQPGVRWSDPATPRASFLLLSGQR